MEAIRIIVLAAASSMLLVTMLMIIISSASAGLTEEEEAPASPSSSTTTTHVAFSAPLHRSDFLFTMKFDIGKTEVYGLTDTGSGLIWTKKNRWLLDDPEMRCPPSDKDGGITSPSCDGRLCTFYGKYVSGEVEGVMGKAKLTFGRGEPAIDNYTYPHLITIGSALMSDDCNQLSSSSDDVLLTDENQLACKAYARGGIVGLNRDPQSLVSQLKVHSFSYCLPHHEDLKAAPRIKFNDPAAVSSSDGTTKMKLDAKYPVSKTHYAVGLKKIWVDKTSEKNNDNYVQVGGCSVKKDAHGKETDDGAMLIDSGTDFTRLPEKVFNDVKKRVEELLIQPGEKLKPVPYKDYSCYQGKYPVGMHMVLEFCTEEDKPGTQMEIPAKNCFFQEKKDGVEDSYYCLAFKTQKDEAAPSILGAYQQQDMHMRFDIEKEIVSFSKPSGCGQSQSQEEENHATL